MGGAGSDRSEAKRVYIAGTVLMSILTWSMLALYLIYGTSLIIPFSHIPCHI
jgi:hypothetical protein